MSPYVTEGHPISITEIKIARRPTPIAIECWGQQTELIPEAGQGKAEQACLPLTQIDQ